MILLSDPQIAAVPGRDDGDPLIDLRDLPDLRLDTRAADPTPADPTPAGPTPAGPVPAHARIRRAVAERLRTAQRSLPDGLRLLIIEGYRPYRAQLGIFTGYRDELRRRYPSWSPARLHRETSKFVSPVEVAPHSTGGAVDLTLCTADGIELDLGTAVDATPADSDNACFTAATNIPAEAARNRRILCTALSAAGLVNYPTEWWHWSYGDRYWAVLTGATCTRYGPLPEPD